MSADYPPNGLSESVKKLPEWIQKGKFPFLVMLQNLKFEILFSTQVFDLNY